MRRFLIACIVVVVAASPAFAGGKQARKRSPLPARAGVQPDGSFVPDGDRFVQDGTIRYDFSGADPSLRNNQSGSFLGGLPAAGYNAFGDAGGSRASGRRQPLPRASRYLLPSAPFDLPPGFGYGSIYGNSGHPGYAPPYAGR